MDRWTFFNPFNLFHVLFDVIVMSSSEGAGLGGFHPFFWIKHAALADLTVWTSCKPKTRRGVSEGLQNIQTDFTDPKLTSFNMIQIHSNTFKSSILQLFKVGTSSASCTTHFSWSFRSTPALGCFSSASHHVTRGTCDTRGKGNQKHPSLEQIQHCTSRFGPEALRFPVGLPW